MNEKRLRDFFEGKTIWITGASSGIGKELALRLSGYGVKNLILTGRSVERLQLVADSCSKQSKELRRAENESPASVISVLPLDMTATQDKFDDTMQDLEKILGDEILDCVVLNAGIGQLNPADKTSSSTTSEIFLVNTLGPISLSQKLLERGILSQSKGRQQLAVTSSVGALIGLPLSSSYAASKHALHGYFNTLRSEKTWLEINLICPGTVDTSFHSSYVGSCDHSGNNPKSHCSKDHNYSPRGKKLKMSLDRCTRLYMCCIMLQNGEHWIAEQPMLAGLYINQHLPWIFRILLAKVGLLRLRAWEEGKDLYDPKTWKDFRRK